MTRDEFDQLVQRLERVAHHSPRGYALRIVALALLGYVYIALVLLVMASLFAVVVAAMFYRPSAVTIKAGIALGAISGGISWAILRGLWVRLPPPQGRRLTPAEAPGLFELIDELRLVLRSPRFHEVLLDGQFNAAVVQLPRLGLFGWQKNHLLVGLPLLQGLSPGEFRAVLAHEFGHLSANHSRFSGWIYRMRRTWERVMEQLGRQQQRGAFVLTRFLGWFWPKFNAHAFVLSRANEYVADACSAQLAGADHAASALQRTSLLAPRLEEQFWSELFRSANDLPSPPGDIFQRCAAMLRRPAEPADSARWLRAAFLLQTTNHDTHPCLADRLRAIDRLPAGADEGRPPTQLAPFSGPSAAEAYLDPTALAALTAELSGKWRAAAAEGWAERHRQARELKQKVASDVCEAVAAVDVPALWARAEAVIQLEGDASALPLIEQVLRLDPKHAAANFVCGRHALERDNPAGVPFLERAMAADEDCVPAACGLLQAYYARTGQREAVRGIEDRMEVFEAMMREAQAERSDVTLKDVLVPHELSAEVVGALQGVFATEREVAAVHIARKVVKRLPNRPFYAVAVRLRVPWWKPRSTDASHKLAARLVDRLQMPGQFLVFTVEERLKQLGRHVAAVPGSQVYVREAS